MNGAVETTETYWPKDLDSRVAITRLRKSHGSNHLRAWSLDFPHSYKTIAPRPGSAEASYICITNHVDNCPYIARILAQPFGIGEHHRTGVGRPHLSNLWPSNISTSRPWRSSMMFIAPMAQKSPNQGSGSSNTCAAKSVLLPRAERPKYLRLSSRCLGPKSPLRATKYAIRPVLNEYSR